MSLEIHKLKGKTAALIATVKSGKMTRMLKARTNKAYDMYLGYCSPEKTESSSYTCQANMLIKMRYKRSRSLEMHLNLLNFSSSLEGFVNSKGFERSSARTSFCDGAYIGYSLAGSS